MRTTSRQLAVGSVTDRLCAVRRCRHLRASFFLLFPSNSVKNHIYLPNQIKG